MDVLVLGGTQFFGKRLVHRLVTEGYRVVVATRGNRPVDFADVEHVIVDRQDPDAMRDAFRGKMFDVVYDQINYSPDDARLACDIFQGNIGRYIFTSSASVYEPQMIPLKEAQFDPRTVELRYGSTDDFTYPEGKRYAEAVLFQRATFPVVAVRFPIVIGDDDCTGRFQFHVERIYRGEPIGIPDKAAKMSFISADEAATFLHWLATNDVKGPINAASHSPLSAKEVVQYIAYTLGKEPMITTDDREGFRSPYYTSVNWTLNLKKAIDAGFQFTNAREWLPDMTESVLSKMRNGAQS